MAIQTSSPAPLPLQLWVLPSSIAPYAPEPIDDFVEQRWRAEALPIEVPTVWIGFSAGVVGAVAAARRWQRRGGLVRGLIAVDGWGVPLGRRFPRYRLSHDRFTAQSCEWLGASDGYFYCDPAVEHLEFWRSPQSAIGHWQPNLGQSNPKSPNPGSQNPGSPQQRFPQKENRLTGDFQQLNQPCSMDAAHCLAQLLWTLAQGT